MAAPLAHIFLALSMLQGPFAHLFDELLFIRGTSFPDIRYLGVIERNQTHAKKVSLETIKNELDSFKAGMLFHAYVDEQREEYIKNHNLYALLLPIPYAQQALKFAEDQWLLNIPGLINKDQYRSYFISELPQEEFFNIPAASLNEWRSLLYDYCKEGTSQELLNALLKPMIHRWLTLLQGPLVFLGKLTIQSIIQLVSRNRQLEEAMRYFYLNFNELTLNKKSAYNNFDDALILGYSII